jgi:hypothetical protein
LRAGVQRIRTSTHVNTTLWNLYETVLIPAG